MKELFIVRHAKSSWDYPNLADYERPLNERGKRDAPKMASLLQAKTKEIDYIVSSPAIRAKETSLEFSRKFRNASVDFKETIYESNVENLTNIVQSFDDQHSKVILVGHNPGLTFLANYYLGDSIGHLPTCGIIGIQFHINQWVMITKELGVKLCELSPKNSVNF